MSKIIIVSGSTASGKTSFSIELAKKFQCEIVNFDSLLFYKGLTIGTAKPNLEERQGVIHHLIDIKMPDDHLNAADYIKLATPLINSKINEGKSLLLVGGSGFYLRALLMGMYDSITTPGHITQKSEQLYEDKGIPPFLEILKENDPDSFSKIHENDHYRIRRAVEHFWTTNSPFSQAEKSLLNKNEETLDNIHGWSLLHFNLKIEKEKHWEIIHKRTLKMIDQGLLDEVQSLLDSGFGPENKPMQSIGYKECVDYIRQTNPLIKSREDLIERIYLNTRRLAKSQKTWFQKDQNAIILDPLNIDQSIYSQVQSFLKDS